MGLFDEVTNFISGNESWLKPVLSFGSNLYKKNESSGNMDDYIKLLRAQEEQNFADTNAYNAAAKEYNDMVASASAANAASASAASAANQRNALAASNKANKQMNKVYKRNKALYEPFKNTALELLPQMTGAYTNSLNNLNMLSAYLQSPEQMAKLNASKPQWAVGAPTPSWAKR